MNQRKKKLYICELIGLVLTILYLIGICDLDYGYYQFLRIFSFFAIAAYVILNYLIFERFGIVTVISVGILILFNPIAPIYLSKAIWIVFDIICAILLFCLNVYIYKEFKKIVENQN